MALKMTLTLMNGITVQNGYIKIDSISGNKNGLNLVVGTYFDKEHSNETNNRLHVPVSHIMIPSDDENSIRWDKQGYEYLKTLPEYAGAIDC